MFRENRFNVYLTGETLNGKSFGLCLIIFCKKFNLSGVQAKKIRVAEMPFRVKNGVSHDKAKALADTINAIGLKTSIEPELVEVDKVISPLTMEEEKSFGFSESKNLVKKSPHSTPESILLPDNKRASFGGWLRVFQVLNILALGLSVGLFIVGVVFSLLQHSVPEDGMLLLIGFIEILPVVIFNVLILRNVTKTKDSIPRKIRSFLNLKFTATMGVYWALYFLYYSNAEQSAEESIARLLGLVITMIYCWGWMFYFKKSKRVNDYYSSNNLEEMGRVSTTVAGRERKFKIPLGSVLSVLMVIGIFAGYGVADSMGSIGVLEFLRPLSFYMFLLIEVALLIVILICKMRLDGFLSEHPTISNVESLNSLRSLAKENSRYSILTLILIGLGTLTAVITISNKDGFSIYVGPLVVCAMFIMAWYRPTEEKIQQLKCTSSELDKELISILDKWGNKVDTSR